ncbi:hypothetical protein C0J50_17230 [Silurus asotus]|uniref:Uncharacterized protein n=1 Tax=Silurus asotus TaxID=30991 RepID=A0AAD5FPG7_SILAS|nr:hypothetical protein C0J50_17230 [Silurus asotus]
MDFGKGGIDGQVNKVIDQAAGAAKKKINETIGGNANKDKKPAGGIGDMVGGAITKAAVDQASGKAADQALAIGKKLIN